MMPLPLVTAEPLLCHKMEELKESSSGPSVAVHVMKCKLPAVLLLQLPVVSTEKASIGTTEVYMYTICRLLLIY